MNKLSTTLKILTVILFSLHSLQAHADISYCVKNVITEKSLLDAKDELDRISKSIRTKIESKTLAWNEQLLAAEILYDVMFRSAELQNHRNITFLNSFRKKPANEGVANLIMKFSIDLVFTKLDVSEKIIRMQIPLIDDYELSKNARGYRDFLENFNKNSVLCR